MKLTEQQKYVLNSGKRFACVVAGRRGGKSYMSIASLAQHARHPNSLCVYVAPTHQMCRQIMWKPLKNMLLDKRWVKKVNESNLELELVNGSIIMLRSADNPDRLRGISISHCVIDEAADIAEETWYEVIRPALADQQGSALIISTPKGKGWLWDLFSRFKNNDDWLCHSYTTAEGGIVLEEEIENARQTMGEREFKQEFLAEWVDFANRVYYAMTDANIVSMPQPQDARTPLHIGLDHNIDPGVAVIAFQHSGGFHVFDEIEMYGTNTHEIVAEIERRYPSRKKFAYPDASGAQRRTSANGITDHIILKNAGYELRVGSVNPAVADRIAAVNSAFRSMDGTIRLTIDPKCRKLLECLEKQVYKDGTRQPSKDGFDHMNDALGYLVNHQLPIRQAIQARPGQIRRSTGAYI